MLVRRYFRLPLAIVAMVAAVLSSGLSVAVGVHAAHATSGFSGAFLDSEPGDYLGQGKTYSLPTVTYNGLRGAYPTFTVSSPTDSFQVWFAAPAGQPLVPGTYESAQRYDTRAAGHPGLDVFGDGRGCNAVAGRFIIDDATYDAQGNVLTFSARFEDHCEGMNPALFGEISYNSTAPFRGRTVSANSLLLTSTAGEAVTQSVTITNNGPATDDPQFAITGINASQFSVLGTTCSGPLAANTSCTATVEFTPLAAPETEYAFLSVADELAPLGSPSEPAGAGQGRIISLTGVAGAATTFGSITGAVEDPNGAPLGGVCVLFANQVTGALTGPEAISASDGTYSISNVQPASYDIYFLNACEAASLDNYAPEIYANAPVLVDATPISVVARQLSVVNAQLTVGGQMTGLVDDASGAGIADVDVTATPLGDVPAVSTTTHTDANGDYDLVGLATGEYTVEFNACPTPSTCQTEWYGSSASRLTSTLVIVMAGQTATTGINATFSGIGTPPATGGGQNGASNNGGGSSQASGGGGSSSDVASTVTTRRIFGADAIATSIATSNAEFTTGASAPAVVLARSDKFSDALAGGPLAASVGGPLLITPGASISAQLDPRVLSEIGRVLVPGGTVYVLGGTGALSPSVDTALEAKGFKVDRVFGADEYATAVAIAHQLGDPTTVFEATGRAFADALSAVPAAIKDHGAILLTNGNVQAPATAAYLAAHPSDTRYAIGGSMAAAGADPSATAVFGADLYSTSAAVAAKFFPAAATFAVATGLKFPDALSGGVMEGTTAGPMLLVPATGSLPAAISSYLQAQSSTMTSGLIFGGSSAVSDAVAGELIAAS
jgi:putative cell wall-binding protein